MAPRRSVELPHGVTLRQIFRCGTAPIRRITWSPDGDRLMGVSTNDVAVIWETETGTLTRNPVRSYGRWNDFAWSPDGRSIAYAVGSAVRIWNIETNHTDHIAGNSPLALSALAWSPGGTRIATAAGQNDLRVWDTRDRHSVASYTRSGLHDDRSVKALVWSRDGDHLVVLADDLYRWTVGPEAPARLHNSGPLTTVALSPDGSVLVTAKPDGTLQVRDPRSMAEELILEGTRVRSTRSPSRRTARSSPPSRSTGRSGSGAAPTGAR